MQRQLSTPAMPKFPEEEGDDDLEAKTVKAPAVRSSSAAERSVHLVPLLTVLCFVLLFLCSHSPSTDMSSFGGKVVGRKPKLF